MRTNGAVTPGPTETNKPKKNKQNSVNNDDSVQYSTVGSVGGIKNTEILLHVSWTYCKKSYLSRK